MKTKLVCLLTISVAVIGATLAQAQFRPINPGPGPGPIVIPPLPPTTMPLYRPPPPPPPPPPPSNYYDPPRIAVPASTPDNLKAVREVVEEFEVQRTIYDHVSNTLTIIFQPNAEARAETARRIIEAQINGLAKQLYQTAVAQVASMSASSGHLQPYQWDTPAQTAYKKTSLNGLLEQAHKEASTGASNWNPPSNWNSRGSIEVNTGPALKQLKGIAAGIRGFD